MNLVIKNIGWLVQYHENPIVTISGSDMKTIPLLQDAWLFCKDGNFRSWGPMSKFNAELKVLDPSGTAKIIDAAGGMVLPSWCDSHTHIVFAAPREQEFVDRIHGLTYEEIA
ncbi:MAG: imidazolonepropionase, partial [Bacteroidia bacterium]|nr:imidazolonepropionase [Bacteroidia bacterium]